MNLLAQAARDPYAALRVVLGGPLHPGGSAATERLLDHADLAAGEVLVDLGCGPGEALDRAREVGAQAIGLDEREGLGDVRARLEALPLADDAVDVVLAECSLCLAGDLGAALAETTRVLAPGGRLAFSDVTVDRPLPEVSKRLAELLCLDGPRSRRHLQDELARAGFAIDRVDDRRGDLLAMRDRVRDRVDVEGLLAAMGERGQRLQAALDQLEAALEAGDVGYVAIVARQT